MDSTARGDAQEHALMADLQDELLTAATDPARPQGLLAAAAAQLVARVAGADAALADVALAEGVEPGGAHALARARDALAGALVALQFQDLSAQLLTHAQSRIHAVADVLALRAMPGDEEAAAPIELHARPCPVAQRQMDAGSVELF